MKILFISGELIGSALVHKLVDEGNDVKLYIDHPDRKDCLGGFVEKINNWHTELSWVGKDGLIIFDDVIFDGAQESLRSEGYRVMGGDSKSDKLELDRSFFHQVLHDAKIPTLPSHDFSTAKEALEFVTKEGGMWVVKQNAHLGVLNYVGQREDGADVINVLQHYDERNIAPVHLQKRAIGIEIGVARYFNGNDWVGPIEFNIEHNALCNGDIGPLTAEMGTVMWHESDENVLLYQETLAKLKNHLIDINYKGDIDINCIVNAEGIWPLEATMRLGTPSTELHCELHLSPWGEFLGAIADGEQYDLEYKNGYGVVVSVAVPPFPYGPEFFDEKSIDTCTGTSVFFCDSITDVEWKQIHTEEVSKIVAESSDRYILAGKHGYVLYVTGHGNTVEAARTSAYRLLKKITIPKMFYRTDIGENFLCGDQKQLRDWGYIL